MSESKEVKQNPHPQIGVIKHYREKFPGGHVYASENEIDVYDAGGSHQVALRKNGAGQWSDQSEYLGCESKHSLDSK